MEIKSFESNGRRLMVEFTCRRCRTVSFRSLKECLDEVDCNFLTDLKPPKDWRNGGFYYPLFCKECAEAYDRFMNLD